MFGQRKGKAMGMLRLPSCCGMVLHQLLQTSELLLNFSSNASGGSREMDVCVCDSFSFFVQAPDEPLFYLVKRITTTKDTIAVCWEVKPFVTDVSGRVEN